MSYRVYAYSDDNHLLPWIDNFIKCNNTYLPLSVLLKEHHGTLSYLNHIDFETEEDFLIFKLKFS